MLVTSDPEFFLQGWFLFPSCPPHGSDPPCGPGSLPAQGQSFWPPPSLLPPHTSVQKKRASLGGPLSLNSDTHQNREPQAATPGLTQGAALLRTHAAYSPLPDSPGGRPRSARSLFPISRSCSFSRPRWRTFRAASFSFLWSRCTDTASGAGALRSLVSTCPSPMGSCERNHMADSS